MFITCVKNWRKILKTRCISVVNGVQATGFQYKTRNRKRKEVRWDSRFRKKRPGIFLSTARGDDQITAGFGIEWIACHIPQAVDSGKPCFFERCTDNGFSQWVEHG